MDIVDNNGIFIEIHCISMVIHGMLSGYYAMWGSFTIAKLGPHNSHFTMVYDTYNEL